MTWRSSGQEEIGANLGRFVKEWVDNFCEKPMDKSNTVLIEPFEAMAGFSAVVYGTTTEATIYELPERRGLTPDALGKFNI